MKKIILGVLVLSSILTKAQEPENKSKVAENKTEKRIDEWEMKTYYLVFLKTGPRRDQDSVTAAKIQEGHLDHLNKMYKEGKMDLAGPMMEKGDIRGICVYNLSSLEETKKLVESDPAVKSGRLVAEIHTWYAAKGSILR